RVGNISRPLCRVPLALISADIVPALTLVLLLSPAQGSGARLYQYSQPEPGDLKRKSPAGSPQGFFIVEGNAPLTWICSP
ncbi:MAG: hypothetical protein ACOY7J_14455, partial [Pseudomonadota bacterium]